MRAPPNQAVALARAAIPVSRGVAPQIHRTHDARKIGARAPSTPRSFAADTVGDLLAARAKSPAATKAACIGAAFALIDRRVTE
jgi:hypothetical protein